MTTDLSTIQAPETKIGLEIEASMLKIQDSFFDLEEEKGFLDEAELTNFQI